MRLFLRILAVDTLLRNDGKKMRLRIQTRIWGAEAAAVSARLGGPAIASSPAGILS